jgi:hypothetical protein
LELSSEKNHTFITIWKSWFSYEPPLLWAFAGNGQAADKRLAPAQTQTFQSSNSKTFFKKNIALMS